MILTVLGWQGPLPGAGGACSGYMIDDEQGARIAVDMGTGSLAALTACTDPRGLSAIVLSHLHWDHISDVLPLGYLAGMANVPVYMPDGPEAAVRAVKAQFADVRPHTAFKVGGMSITFGPARHPVPAASVRIECGGIALVYTGDTNTCTGLADFAKGADVLLADAGLKGSDWAENKPHLSPELCACLARDCGAGRLILTHLHPANDPDALVREAKTVFADTAAAFGGMTVRV